METGRITLDRVLYCNEVKRNCPLQYAWLRLPAGPSSCRETGTQKPWPVVHQTFQGLQVCVAKEGS